jgi:hypothetical protein
MGGEDWNSVLFFPPSEKRIESHVELPIRQKAVSLFVKKKKKMFVMSKENFR